MLGRRLFIIRINQDLAILEKEFKFKTSRSRGPGGQNVNKVASRVMLLFDVDCSVSLSENQKILIRSRLANRINKDGILRVISQQHRTQLANRKAAIDRFSELLSEALKKQKIRRKTNFSRSAKRLRLEEKSRRSQLKQLRSETGFKDE